MIPTLCTAFCKKRFPTSATVCRMPTSPFLTPLDSTTALATAAVKAAAVAAVAAAAEQPWHQQRAIAGNASRETQAGKHSAGGGGWGARASQNAIQHTATFQFSISATGLTSRLLFDSAILLASTSPRLSTAEVLKKKRKTGNRRITRIKFKRLHF
jgi:hypothetical protein